MKIKPNWIIRLNMENQKYNIDEIFRQRLHDAEVPPPPFVWPAVEQGLQKRPRRGLLLWVFALGALVTITLLWSWNAWNNKQSNQSFATIAAEQKQGQETSLPPSAGSSNSRIEKSGIQPATPGSSHPERADMLPKAMLRSQKNSAPSTGNLEQINTQSTTNLETPQPQYTLNPTAILSPLTLLRLEPVLSAESHEKGFSQKVFQPVARRKKGQPKLCYDFARHPSAWLLDIYAGPALAQRSLTSRLDDKPYLNQRLATERRSTSMNAGLRATLLFNRNFLVRTGLHMDRVMEVFEYIDPTYVKLSINTIVVNGQIVGVDTVVSYGENYLKTYNRYSMLDIPLLVGVEMRRGRSGISINAGISANVLFQKSGVIIDPSTQEPARFGPIPEKPNMVGPKNSLNQEVFRTNTGLSATVSIQWYCHLSPHFRLFMEPSFRQVLRPISLNSHPVEQRYSILGLRLGATKIF